jgi:hypothetical protein
MWAELSRAESTGRTFMDRILGQQNEQFAETAFAQTNEAALAAIQII